MNQLDTACSAPNADWQIQLSSCQTLQSIWQQKSQLFLSEAGGDQNSKKIQVKTDIYLK